MSFLGQEEQVREFQDRFRYVYAFVFIGIGLLLCRLIFLQILKGDQMRHFSEENRIKRVKIAAPRGMIFDRNRRLLIDNRPAFDLEVTPQYLYESKQTDYVVAMLSKMVHMSEADIRDVLDRGKYEPSFLPIKIKTDLTRDEVAAVESWKISMPGVDVREEIQRTNVYGDVASHLLGYIGEVSAIELPIVNKTEQRYKLGDEIGKFGLEQKMEDTIRGIDGEEIKEVDALGRVKLDKGKSRALADEPGRDPVPGKNLILTIDQDIQSAATKAFGEKIGAMVAISPKTGEILGMLSRPSFDPTEFSRGIPAATWAKLLSNENHPLRDKTIQDHYPPGSTFKLITAIAGLQEGVIDEKTTFHCSGVYWVGNRPYHCHKKGGHGDVNVVSALTQSCDIFFYHVAQRLKSVDDIAKWAFAVGLGQKTGVSLAREVPGLIPTEAWKLKRYNQPWNVGETVSVAIGQSYVLTTAIQLANAYAAVGNGGTLYRPYLIKEIESYDGKVLKTFHPEIIHKIDFQPKTLDLVKQGLWGVINSPHGTAYRYRIDGADMAGKTGTAQVMSVAAAKIYQKCENLKFNDRHHALFVAFAPVNDPVIAVAVIGEHACHGGSGAGPIARAVVQTYLEKYYPDQFGPKAMAARARDHKGLSSFPSMLTGTPPSGPNDDDEVVLPDHPTLMAPALPPVPVIPTSPNAAPDANIIPEERDE